MNLKIKSYSVIRILKYVYELESSEEDIHKVNTTYNNITTYNVTMNSFSKSIVDKNIWLFLECEIAI